MHTSDIASLFLLTTFSEVLLCDFTAGVRVVSFLHVATPDTDGFPSPGLPPDSDVCQCFLHVFRYD
jgi:hypothetical protein